MGFNNGENNEWNAWENACVCFQRMRTRADAKTDTEHYTPHRADSDTACCTALNRHVTTTAHARLQYVDITWYSPAQVYRKKFLSLFRVEVKARMNPSASRLDYFSITILEYNLVSSTLYRTVVIMCTAPKHVAQNTAKLRPHTRKTTHNTDGLLWRNTTIIGIHSKILTETFY
jgi:hypothetical protein